MKHLSEPTDAKYACITFRKYPNTMQVCIFLQLKDSSIWILYLHQYMDSRLEDFHALQRKGAERLFRAPLMSSLLYIIRKSSFFSVILNL